MQKAQGISHIAFKYLFEILTQKYCFYYCFKDSAAISNNF